jgi:hypothetical protein
VDDQSSQINYPKIVEHPQQAKISIWERQMNKR